MRVEEKSFLRAAVAALPRIAEIISGYAPDDRAGALEIAETFHRGRSRLWLHRDRQPISRFYTYETIA
jgi:hypothetical protein